MQNRYKLLSEADGYNIYDMKPNNIGETGRCIRKYKNAKAAMSFFKTARANEQMRENKKPRERQQLPFKRVSPAVSQSKYKPLICQAQGKR